MSDDGPSGGGLTPMPRYETGADSASLPVNRAAVNLAIPLDGGRPPAQHRWTILIRLLLAIPQAIVLIFVEIAVAVVGVVGWFATLATGRLPESMRALIIYGLRWSLRVSSYLFLLTDHYPPFNGDVDPAYPIGIDFPDGAEFNRLSVLVRIVLIIPAWIVEGCLAVGSLVFMGFFWIGALVLGRLPDPVYRAMAVSVRYNVRFSAFLWGVTPEYPWGAWGDRGVASVPAATDQFDFRLRGWSFAWIWVFLVVGLLYQRSGGTPYR